MSLKKAAMKGAFWSALSTVFSRGLRFVITILLARVLLPEDFGLISMAMVVMDVAEMLRDLGLGAALIQRKHLDPEHLHTCFWANLGIGAFLWGLTLLIAEPAAVFYHNPAVRPILQVMAINFLISPIGSIPWVLLTRELRFKELMIAQSIQTVVRGATSLILAWKGFGVWSLVWGPITGTVAGSFVNWLFCKWRPAFVWSKKHFMDLLHFGKNVFGERLLGYFVANSDFLVTGRALGAETLGFYNFAYQIPHLAETHVVPIVGRVLFPVLSQVQDDLERLRRGYLQTLRLIASTCAPFSALLYVSAPEFIPVVYGSRWQPVVLPLQILCLAGFSHALTNTVWTVQQAVGRSDIGFWWNLISLPFIIGTLIFSSRWGILGIAVTMGTLSVVLSAAIQHITNRLIRLSWLRWFEAVRSPVLASLGAVAAALPMRIYLLNLRWIQPEVLIGTLATGLLTYTALLYFFDPTLFPSIYRTLLPQAGK